MKVILNLLIVASIIVMMSDCEANAGRTALNYNNSIFAGFTLLTCGFLRVYYKDFMNFLTRPQ